MKLIPIYEGPTVLVEMLRDTLRERGIEGIIQAGGPYLGIIADRVQAPFSILLISDHDRDGRSQEVEDCLSLMAPVADEPDAEAPDPETGDA
jgi:hypothetical protein